jgi:linearmycin/streptolysin S transport system permease protein
MKKIFAIAFRDASLRFTSVIDWLFFLILPVIFTIILAGGTAAQQGDNRIRLAVVDQAGTSLSADLVAALEKSDSVRPDLVTLAQAESQYSQRGVSAVLIIPAGFTQANLQQGSVALELRQQPNNTNAIIAQQAVMTVIGRLSSVVDVANQSVAAAEKIRPFPSEVERLAYFDTSLAQAQSLMAASPSLLAVTLANSPDQIEYDPRANSSAGQLITWVFIPLIGLSEMFAAERQAGTLRRVLTTPTRKATYLFGTIFGQVILALVQMILLVGFGILVMQVKWGNDIGGLAVMLLAGALAAAALGTMLGTFVKSAGQAQGLSIMLGMVMALMGGCWYPLELFPKVIQNIVKILPTTWTMQGLLDLILRGKGLIGILPEAGVLIGFAAVFFTIGVLRFRYE